MYIPLFEEVIEMQTQGYTLFQKHPDGSIEPKCKIRVQLPEGHAEFGPGTRFNRGVSFGGVNVFQIYEGEFDADTLDDGSVVIELS